MLPTTRAIAEQLLAQINADPEAQRESNLYGGWIEHLLDHLEETASD